MIKRLLQEETRPGSQPFIIANEAFPALPGNRRWERPHSLPATPTNQTEEVAPPAPGKDIPETQLAAEALPTSAETNDNGYKNVRNRRKSK